MPEHLDAAHDGRIAFRGRIDEQVKIRGNRVELEEVSRVLSRHSHVSACVVVASGVPGIERRLIAYVVPTPDAALTSRELHEFLAATLPSYMVPAAFVRLAALPITSNSKLDRRALPGRGSPLLPRQHSPSMPFRYNIGTAIITITAGHFLLIDRLMGQVRRIRVGQHEFAARLLR